MVTIECTFVKFNNYNAFYIPRYIITNMLWLHVFYNDDFNSVPLNQKNQYWLKEKEGGTPISTNIYLFFR